MSQTCRPAKCIEAIRIALLDPCTLLPACGPLNGYAMGCIIDPDWTPEIEEGDESIVKDNCGIICLQDLVCDQVKRHSMEFKIARPDPEFISMIGGDNLVVSDGQSVGVQQLTEHCSPWLFVELFEKTDDCDTNGDPIYFRHVFPRTRLTWTGNEKEGVFRLLHIEGKTQPIPVANIGTGPYGDIPGYVITSPPGAQSDYVWFEDTTVPEIVCGAIPVPCPIECDELIITDVSADCPTYTITGTCLELINQVQFDGCFGIDAYDPAGPDAGSTHGWLQVNQWTPTVIEIEVVNMNGYLGNNCGNPQNLTLFGPGGAPNYGSFPVGDLSCPQIQSYNSPACEQVCFHGTGFLAADELHTSGSGSFGGTYYNPAGPNAGLNGSTIVTWTDTQICLTNPNFAGSTLNGGHLYGLGGSPDFGSHFNGNVTPDACPPAPNFSAVTSPECCTLRIEGTGMSQINHLQIPDFGLDYYDPAGPDAGSNPGSAVINEWSGSAIEIYDTQLCDVTIDGNVHIWGVGDSPDFGNHGVGPIHIDPCPILAVDSAAASDCFTLDIFGTAFDTVNAVQLSGGGPGPYYDPNGPDAGSNPPSATINLWSPTHISITDPAAFVGTTNGVQLFAVGGGDYGTFPYAEITLFSCPIIASAGTENCDEFVMYSDGGFEGFTQANHLRIQTTPGGFVDYYNPAGPDAGSNPGTATILSWTDTEIRIVDTALGDTNEALVNAQFFGVGDTPTFPIQDLSSFVISDCDDVPGITNSYSPSCDTFVVEGGRFDLVDHIVVTTDSGTLDYYDPAGPNNGLNPGTAQLVGWTPSSITIYDTQITDWTVQTIQLLDVGDATDYGTFDIGNYLIPDCPAPALISANDSGVDRFSLHGTGFSSLMHIRLVPVGANPGPYDYFNPAMPGGYPVNPGFVTVLSWTDTLIEIQHTGISTVVDKFHLWGCCGPLGIPDYGEVNVPNFVVN